MEIICSHCQKDFILPIKKSIRSDVTRSSASKTHKIVTCPHCGRKNYVSILQKHGYSESY